MSDYVARVLDGYSRGWSFTPVRGKRPYLTGWQSRPRETVEELTEWATQGKVGLRTGAASGVVVIDADPGADIDALNLPTTLCCKTPRGCHYYFAYTGRNIGNSSGKLGQNIDVRGTGGQVVYYADWLNDEPIADLPQHIVEALALTMPTEPPARPRALETYQTRAVAGEIDKILAAGQGTRNTTLNRAAFRCGQLVGSGTVEREYAESQLADAARAIGLGDVEIRQTIDSGLSSGLKHPRSPSDRTVDAERPVRRTNDVLMPGAHITSTGEYIEVGTNDFADNVLRAIPAGSMYRRGGIVGEIRGGRFETLEVDRTRLLVDRNVRIRKWVAKGRGEAAEQIEVYQTCSTDCGRLVLAEAYESGLVPDVSVITTYPVYLPDWTLARPGMNPGGVYYHEPEDLSNVTPIVDPSEIIHTLESLVTDFVFANAASRENMYGLMLTPIIRPAIDGNVPMHLVTAPLERTGKTKLVEQVLGISLLGKETPVIQLGDDIAEQDKRVLSHLQSGETIVHLDNLPPFIDSGVLASLLTGTVYRGRMLGTNRIAEYKNNLVIVATGNNTQMTSELAKRVIPIGITPRDSSPETRRSFIHPELAPYCRQMRVRTIACLLGMVERWKLAGMPRSTRRMGGFEEWSLSVGGILASSTYHDWMNNATDWRDMSDPETEDQYRFVEAWLREWGFADVSASTLQDLAVRLGAFRDNVRAGQSRSGLISFSRRVLSALVDRPIGDHVVRRVGGKGDRMYRLREVREHEQS